MLDGLSEVVINITNLVTVVDDPVTIIGEQVEVTVSTLSNVRGDPAAQGSRADGDGKSNAESSQLEPALLLDSAAILERLESC